MALFAMLALLVGVIPMARAVRADADTVEVAYSVKVSDATATEGNSGQKTVTFTLTLTPAAVTDVVVNYNTDDAEWQSGTQAVATAGSDYQSKSSSVTFNASNPTTRNISVTLLGDTIPEPNEIFDVVAAVQGGTSTDRGTGTIVNDDAAPPSIRIADLNKAEGDSGSTTFGFTVTRDGDTSQPVDFTWRTQDDTALDSASSASGGDYNPVTTAAGQIPAGQTTTVVNVTVFGDTEIERNETFVVEILQSANAGVSDASAKGTIIDDDDVVLRFKDTVVGDEKATVGGVETGGPHPGNSESGATRTFTVEIADGEESGQTVTVDYDTKNDTAIAPGDYTAKAGTLTFVPGDKEEDIVVNVNDDNLPEATEEFLVELSDPVNATLGADDTAKGRIADNDTTNPNLDVSNARANEPDTGTTPATFNLSLSFESGQAITANYATVAGTATSPADYTHTTGTVTFAAGETLKTVTVPVVGDTTAEGNEKFKLDITSVTTNNATDNCLSSSDDCGTGTIVDDETVTLSILDSSATEGNPPAMNSMAFSVVLSTALAQDVKVEYHTEDGTARASEDYTTEDSEITIEAGETEGLIEIPITADTFGEPTETFTVVLDRSDVATIQDGTAVGEINDNDSSVPTVSIADASNAESGDMSFTVTLTGTPNPAGTTVNYATTPGSATAPADFASETGSVTLTATKTTDTIVIDVTDDTIDETAESFTVTLSNPSNGTIDDGEATGTITDNDGPSVAITDQTVTEGNAGTTNAVFTVSITEASVEPIDVDYATAHIDTEDGDYTPTSGTLTFPAGSTASQTVTVPVTGDLEDEPNETFKVALTLDDPSRATLGKADGIGTIIDNDGPAISIADAAPVTEGLSGTTNAVFNVTISDDSEQVVTVDYTTVDQTATATAPGDYNATTGTLTFPASSTTAQTVNVPVKGDNIDEENETFKVVLSNPQNANLADDGEATGTINDDDGEPALSIGDQSVTEGDTTAVPATLTATLSRPSSKTVTANYTTANGTATAPGDYTAKSGTVTFAPGETTKNVTVLVAGDTAIENNETFFVDLSTPTSATILDARGQATIVDNDAPAGSNQGYWMTGRDAGIFAFGNAKFHGSMGGQPLNQPIVGMASTPSGNGYWQVASDGGIFAWGDATFYGSKGGQPLNKPVVGMASTADGGGYWLVASDGGIFTFGNAGFHGSKGGQLLNKPIVGMAATPSGNGYWMVASDGGIFSFGDATFYGSTGGSPLNQPIVGMAATPDGGGYWMVASDGGIFTFGNASFYGSTGGRSLNGAIVGMGRTPTGTGYWLAGSDGAIFAFGDAKPLGSMAGKPLNAPIVGIAAHPG
ncbi:MAG TPA: Calx-beta domain-containing protein [Acidimicrobiales bacterium]|nr:Calx-beta domain-containing protein [Acidimicrobiales bacterium]